MRVIPIESLDPDYRRQPKTSVYCLLCQRDITGNGGAQVHLIEIEGNREAICHPADIESAGRYIGPAMLGPECCKKVPAEYFD